MISTLKNIVFVSLVEEDSNLAEEALRRWSCDADRLARPRRRSLVCRALLRGLLGEITSVSSADWRIAAEDSGRPTVHGDRDLTPSISFSHSDGWAGFALAFGGEVGIDMEAARKPRDFAALAARAFGPDERRRVRKEHAAGFYRIWVLREALAKASGRGLSEVMDRRDRAGDGPDEGTWWSVLDDKDWLLSHARPQPGLSLGIALQRGRPAGGETPVALEWWRPR